MQRFNRVFLIPIFLFTTLIWGLPSSTLSAQQPLLQSDGFLLPAPTGPYSVGRTSRYWIDESREEAFTDAADDLRELIIRIWYPAEPEAGAEPGAYAADLAGELGQDAIEAWLAFIAQDPIVPWFSEHIGGWVSHAFPDAAVSDGQATYPVLIFSPGLHSFPEQYTTQIEELASHGYIVVGINHPYTSGVTVFPDERIVATLNFRLTSIAVIEQILTTQAEDIVFVLDSLETLNADDPEGVFTGRLNLEQVGVFGHSLGGGAAIIAGARDARIQAILAEDGALLPPGRFGQDQITAPLMSFTSADTGYGTAGPYYQATVDGFAHMSFADDPVWPLPPEVAFANGERVVAVVRAFTLAFFDKHLKGEDVTLLDGASDDFPEVTVEASNTE